MDRRYVYFVSYWFTNGLNTQGFGHCEMFRFEPIETHQDAVDMGEAIEHRTRPANQERHVTILSWQLLQVQRRAFPDGWEKIKGEEGDV